MINKLEKNLICSQATRVVCVQCVSALMVVYLRVVVPTKPSSCGIPGQAKSKQTLSGHRGTVYSVALSPDGSTLASGSYDHTIRLWDLHTGKLKRTLTGHTERIYSVAFNPDGNTKLT